MSAMSRFLWVVQALLGGLALTAFMLLLVLAGCAALAALAVIIVFASY